ncbi:MAG TPA: nucleoside-diphosphate kinase [Actinomycetota bacterium]|jgi:nucleoside-diphosphate kinase|nr:nucleoside-diphosphate kinase [Actinomycetota bacterium]
METTLVIIKPDAVRRGLVGEIVRRLEDKGLTLVQGRLFTIDAELAHRHYAEHNEKPFFADLIDFITSGPVLVLAVRGPKAVQVVRTLMGPTNPLEAPPGTIRGDFGNEITQNLIHGSDSVESAERELALYFPEAK